MRTVLIVEDDRDLRETIAGQLRQSGHVVFEAGNGREALSVLADHPETGLILLDLIMPVMNGLEFLYAKGRLPEARTVPVVLMTAYFHNVRQIHGVMEVLAKPIDEAQLLAAIARHYREQAAALTA